MRTSLVIATVVTLLCIQAWADSSSPSGLEPQMTRPSALIAESGRVIVIKSELKNWMNIELRQLLNSGLTLTLEFEAGVFERRDFWFDIQIASVIVTKRITYDPVTKSFTIVVPSKGKEPSLNFTDRKEAMDYLLDFSTFVPTPLLMEKYSKRCYYAGVDCEVEAREMVFPLGYLLWFRRSGYTTEWSYSQPISTKVLQGDGLGKKKKRGANPKDEREPGSPGK